jgi:hypothetical protein
VALRRDSVGPAHPQARDPHHEHHSDGRGRAAIWLIGSADFTGIGRSVSDGTSQTLNVAFSKLPSPGQSNCLPVQRNDPQVKAVTYSYASGNGIVDQNANELWTVLVCKPWLDGEFGTTTFATAPGGRPTPVNTYGRQLLWSQAVAINEKPTASLIQAKQATYSGIVNSIQQNNPISRQGAMTGAMRLTAPQM